jgi:hypothetical protein
LFVKDTDSFIVRKYKDKDQKGKEAFNERSSRQNPATQNKGHNNISLSTILLVSDIQTNTIL